MKDRIRLIRRSLREKPKVSQTEFANMLGTTRPAIAKYESGDVVPTDTFIQLMCSKFNIDEHWLRTGEGDMYRSMSREEELFQWLHGICDDGSDFEKRFVSALARLDATEWSVLERMLDKIYSEDVLTPKKKAKPPAAQPQEPTVKQDAPPKPIPTAPSAPITSADDLSEEELRQIDEEVELIRQQKILERTRMSTASSFTAWG